MTFRSGMMEVGEEESRSFRGPLAMAGKALAAVAAVSAAALAVKSSLPVSAVTPAAIGQATQLEQMVIQGPRDGCSPPWTSKSKPENMTENCINTKCCANTGYNCFQKSPGVAGCLEGCKEKGWDCTQPNEVLNLVDVKEIPNTRFYCFAVFVQDTGNPDHKPGPQDELEILRKQYEQGVGVFSCPGNDVFGDNTESIGAGYNVIKVDDVLNEFHLIKRKKTKTWVNTGIFKQVWKKIDEKGSWREYDWVIKLDADAVFVHWRLQKMLSSQPVSWEGVYLENCIEVQYGFFGNIEVISHKAFETLVSNIDSCGSDIKWASMQATKWGPIGEDLFAQKCMDSRGVSKVQNFDLTVDGACPGIKKLWGQKNAEKFVPECEHVTAPAMHPFKTAEKWFDCYQKTIANGA